MEKFIPIILVGIFFIFQIFISVVLYHLKRKKLLKNKVIKFSSVVVNWYFISAIPITIIQMVLLEVACGDIGIFVITFVMVCLLYCLVLILFQDVFCDNNVEKRILIPIIMILWIGTIIFAFLYHRSHVNFVMKEETKKERVELLYVNGLPVLEEISSDEMISYMKGAQEEDEPEEGQVTYWYFDENNKAKSGTIEKENVMIDFLKENTSEAPYLEMVTKTKKLMRIQVDTGKEKIVSTDIGDQEYYFYLPEFFKSYVFLE